jgi:hypothetical protein
VGAVGLVERSLQLKHVPDSDQLKYIIAVKKRHSSLSSVRKTAGYGVERPGSNKKFIFEFRFTQEGHASLDNTTSQLGAVIMYPFQYFFISF